MKWSFTVGKIKNISFKIHFTFILILLWVAITGITENGMETGLTGTFFVVCIFFCVFIHELAHSLLAQKYNIKVESITLLPIGGVANIQKIPEDPAQEIKISSIGPFSNLVIGFILYIILTVSGYSWTGFNFYVNAYTTDFQEFLVSLININMVLAGFNLIPAFPMDGGRILRSIITIKTKNFTKATKIASIVGQITAIAMIFYGFLYNIWLLFIGFFIYIGAGNEEHQVEIRNVLKHITANDIMTTEFHILKPDDDFSQVFKFFFHGFQNDFPVLENEKLVGVLTKNKILAAIHEKGLNTKIHEIMETDFKVVTPDITLNEIYLHLTQNKNVVVPVVKEGKVLGTISLDNISRYLMVHSAFASV